MSYESYLSIHEMEQTDEIHMNQYKLTSFPPH